jgi:hypothetical protein
MRFSISTLSQRRRPVHRLVTEAIRGRYRLDPLQHLRTRRCGQRKGGIERARGLIRLRLRIRVCKLADPCACRKSR